MGGAYDFSILRTLRQQQNLTLENLSKLSGLSYPTIALIETNKTFPSLKTLDALATALKTPVSQLISLAEHSLVKTGSAEPIPPKVLQASDINLDTLCLLNFQGLKLLRGTVRNGGIVNSSGFHGDCECNEMCYCLSGFIKLRIKDEVYQLQKNDVAIFDGCLDHEYTASAKTEFLVVHLPKDSDFMAMLIKNKKKSPPLQEFP